MDTKKHIENWAELFFQILIISLVYNSWIEYFPSICGLDESKGVKQFRNLGGLILGYKTDASITQEERSVFRIISARISSTVAGQWMHEYNREINRGALRKELKEKYTHFKSIIESNQLHGITQIQNNQFNKIKEYIKSNEHAFSKDFVTYLDNLKKNNSDHISKYCLVELKENIYCSCQINNPIHQFSKPNITDPKCHTPISNMTLINIPFINGLFSSLSEPRINGTCKIKEKQISGRQITFYIEYSEDFLLEEFYTKLKKSHNGTLIGNYFIENYSLLDAHGIFKIIDNDNKEIFNSREMINMVIDNKLILNESRFITESSNLKSLKLIFINELI